MADPFTLERERAKAALSLAEHLLPLISQANSREVVATALTDGRAEVARLVNSGGMDIHYGSSLLALLETSADERLREFPVPGIPAPVGLFAGGR